MASCRRSRSPPLRDHLMELAARGVEDGAIVCSTTRPATSSRVGSAATCRAPEVDGVVGAATGRRQAPLRARDRRASGTAASLVDDSPLAIPTARRVRVPQNYDRDFRGSVNDTHRRSRACSTCAILELIGVDRFHDVLRKLDSRRSCSRTTIMARRWRARRRDVTLVALANAYRVLANGGVWSPVPLSHAGWCCRSVTIRRSCRADAAFVVTDIRRTAARPPSASNLLCDTRLERAWTGTSKDMRDNWCIGYRLRYTVGVLGRQNFLRNAPMHVSGVTGAAPVWRPRALPASRVALGARPPPASLVATRELLTRLSSRRAAWFITRQSRRPRVRRRGGRARRRRVARAAIRYPRPTPSSRSIPTFPPAHQWVAFECGRARARRSRWRVDDDELPDRGSRKRCDFKPVPGRHVVMLVDADGAVLARVRFRRGSLPRVAAQTMRLAVVTRRSRHDRPVSSREGGDPAVF